MIELDSGHPTVSVDNMAGQYFDDVDLDLDAIADFYENLPGKDKKPLDQCHIHLSALAYQERAGIVNGVFYSDKSENFIHDPQTPSGADIVILMGSGKLSEHQPYKTLGHELVHYSENHGDFEKPKDEIVLQMEHSLLTSTKTKLAMFAGKNAFTGAVLYELNSIIGAPQGLTVVLGQLAVINVIDKIYRSKFKKKKSFRAERIEEIEAELLSRYQNRPEEQAANNHGCDIDEKALYLQSKTNAPEVLARRRGSKNRMVDFVHRQASLGQLKLSKNKTAK